MINNPDHESPHKKRLVVTDNYCTRNALKQSENDLLSIP